MPATDRISGKSDASILIVASRPSLIITKLFSTLGDVATIAFLLMAITAIALLIVEIVSVLFGARLTRSITRAVADLYAGTTKVQAGDFSHRIPVRKTKDQLSELAGVFVFFNAYAGLHPDVSRPPVIGNRDQPRTIRYLGQAADDWRKKAAAAQAKSASVCTPVSTRFFLPETDKT
jgi:HAMP domain-containing protein